MLFSPAPSFFSCLACLCDAFSSVADPWHPNPCLSLTDPNPALDSAFSLLTVKTPTEDYFFLGFSAYYFLKVHLHHFSKIKINKEVTKQGLGIRVFLTIFAWLLKDLDLYLSDEWFWSGSRRPKNIRIRIRNTGFFMPLIHIFLLQPWFWSWRWEHHCCPQVSPLRCVTCSLSWSRTVLSGALSRNINWSVSGINEDRLIRTRFWLLFLRSKAVIRIRPYP